jgi:hypothetical protein
LQQATTQWYENESSGGEEVINPLCSMLYQQSGKCNRNMVTDNGYNFDSYYKQGSGEQNWSEQFQNQLTDEGAACSFIDQLQHTSSDGNWWDLGYLFDPQNYQLFVDNDMSTGMLVGLIISGLAFMLMLVWVCCLRRSIARTRSIGWDRNNASCGRDRQLASVGLSGSTNNNYIASRRSFGDRFGPNHFGNTGKTTGRAPLIPKGGSTDESDSCSATTCSDTSVENCQYPIMKSATWSDTRLSMKQASTSPKAAPLLPSILISRKPISPSFDRRKSPPSVTNESSNVKPMPASISTPTADFPQVEATPALAAPSIDTAASFANHQAVVDLISRALVEVLSKEFEKDSKVEASQQVASPISTRSMTAIAAAAMSKAAERDSRKAEVAGVAAPRHPPCDRSERLAVSPSLSPRVSFDLSEKAVDNKSPVESAQILKSRSGASLLSIAEIAKMTSTKEAFVDDAIIKALEPSSSLGSTPAEPYVNIEISDTAAYGAIEMTPEEEQLVSMLTTVTSGSFIDDAINANDNYLEPCSSSKSTETESSVNIEISDADTYQAIEASREEELLASIPKDPTLSLDVDLIEDIVECLTPEEQEVRVMTEIEPSVIAHANISISHPTLCYS